VVAALPPDQIKANVWKLLSPFGTELKYAHMCVCVCVCVCVCMYACLYVDLCVCMFTRTPVADATYSLLNV